MSVWAWGQAATAELHLISLTMLPWIFKEMSTAVTLSKTLWLIRLRPPPSEKKSEGILFSEKIEAAECTK